MIIKNLKQRFFQLEGNLVHIPIIVSTPYFYKELDYG